jgi:hypothetical protein
MNKQRIKDKILTIYNQDPRIASDDALLLALYWGDEWDYTQSLYSNLKSLTRAETITRRRRELINEGKIKPTIEVLDERMKAFVNERDMHSSQAGFGDMLRRLK